MISMRVQCRIESACRMYNAGRATTPQGILPQPLVGSPQQHPPPPQLGRLIVTAPLGTGLPLAAQNKPLDSRPGQQAVSRQP